MRIRVVLLVFLLIDPACRALAEDIICNPVLNGDFAGYPELGIPPEHFWHFLPVAI